MLNQTERKNMTKEPNVIVQSMAEQYVLIAEEEEGGVPIDFPIESDGTLMLTTIKSVFPSATCLLHRNSGNSYICVIGFNDGRFQPPHDGWGNRIYWCLFPNQNTNPHRIPVVKKNYNFAVNFLLIFSFFFFCNYFKLNEPVPNPGSENTSSIATSIQRMSHGSNETDGSASKSMTQIEPSSSSTSTFLTALSTTIPESMRIDWKRFFINLGLTLFIIFTSFVISFMWPNVEMYINRFNLYVACFFGLG